MNEEAAKRVVDRYRQQLFVWGAYDCVHFVTDFLDARHGTSFRAQLALDLPAYDDPRSALRVLAKFGRTADPLSPWETAITRYLGPPVPCNEIQFGDVVLGRGPYEERTVAMGICDEEFFMAPAERGLIWVPIHKALRGWKCPRT